MSKPSPTPPKPKALRITCGIWEVFHLHFTDGKIVTMVVRIEEQNHEDHGDYLSAHVDACFAKRKLTKKNSKEWLTAFKSWPAYIAQTRNKMVMAGFPSCDGAWLIYSFMPDGTMKHLDTVYDNEP